MKRPALKPTDLLLILLALAGIILFWVQVDPSGYLIYSSLILMTLTTAFRQFTGKSPESKYPKILLVVIVVLIVFAGLDQMTFRVMSPLVFPICYIFYILIQPKPVWITRP